MLSGLEIALAAAGLVIGLTGTWSPCGFSMIETIGPTGHTGGRRTAIAASATFLPGAVAGGMVTFGALAALGGLVHGAGRVAYLLAAAIAVVAAIAEARGTPIVPQIRRQLPEHWRRVLPMPVAAAMYGVLLGLGFTTFVLSFGVWALAGISFAVGDLDAGLAIGAAFGIGRAIPIAVLAPMSDRPAGIRATEMMAERPGDLPRHPGRRRAGAARRGDGAHHHRHGDGGAHRGARTAPTRPPRASTSRGSSRTGPGSCAAPGSQSRFPGTIRPSATSTPR